MDHQMDLESGPLQFNMSIEDGVSAECGQVQSLCLEVVLSKELLFLDGEIDLLVFNSVEHLG